VRRLVGIDPGLHGGFGVLDLEGGGGVIRVELVPTPIVARIRVGARKPRNEYDPARMREVLARVIDGRDPGIRHVEVVLEAQGARPGQGVASSYKTGVGFGLWLGLVVGMRVAYRIVQPLAWKRHAGLVGQDKRASRLRAQERFPALGVVAPADEGPAEGLLLAAYVAATRTEGSPDGQVARPR